MVLPGVGKSSGELSGESGGVPLVVGAKLLPDRLERTDLIIGAGADGILGDECWLDGVEPICGDTDGACG